MRDRITPILDALMGEEKPSFLDYFEELEDPRVDRTKLYSIEEILLLLGVICGCDGWKELESFGKIKIDFLREYLPYKNDTPSDDTLRRFFRALDPKKFQECFSNWACSWDVLVIGLARGIFR
jgi:hypothetical protein